MAHGFWTWAAKKATCSLICKTNAACKVSALTLTTIIWRAVWRAALQAIHADIGEDLSLFSDNAFDFVILSQTLQSIRRPPQELLNEMLRIGRTVIVSFPNFGYWPMRLQLLAGYMPSNKVLPHAWHNTPNVRFCTIADFEVLCRGILF